MKTISQLDPNFKTAPALPGGNYVNIDEPPFRVYGVQKDEVGYYRMTPSVAERVNEGVIGLNRNTAGGVVKFRTNATTLSLRAERPVESYAVQHMTMVASAGFNAYCGTQLLGSFFPCLCYENGNFVFGSFSGQIDFAGASSLKDAEGFFDVTLYMPLYGGYGDISLCVPEGFEFRATEPFPNAKPIVFYGSSITQGACTDAPGNAYINILSRRLNRYCLNLGFSGSARAEDAMIEYLAGLDMSIFVLDYDHNAPTTEHLRNTHEKLFQAVRNAHPNIPIVMASSIPWLPIGRYDPTRREIIRQTYEHAVAKGDKNVYFIDGASFFESVPFDYCTVEGCHPNTLGMYLMAEGFYAVLKDLV